MNKSIKLFFIIVNIFINNCTIKYINLKNCYLLFENLCNNNTTKNKLYYKENKYFLPNDKVFINISFSLNNNIIYQTLVVMTSILENNDSKKHYLIFYLLLSNDFDDKNIEIIESLKLKYQLTIKYYYIPNLFNGLITWRKSYANYYKLLIPILIPNIKKVIHLDGDTLVFKDLWELFNLPFNDNYYLAQPTRNYIFKDKKFSKRVINVGVMLINIEKIRKDNKDFECLYFLFKKKFNEQKIINYICLPKIGYLPFKYGIFAYIHTKNNNYKNFLEMKLDKKVNITEVIEAIKNPSIIHAVNCRPKHWFKRNKTLDNSTYEACAKYHKLFYYYAKKTNYYQIIINKFIKK